MQLGHVEIQDFRGIRRLSLDLDHLTTVIGEPDAGKSSLLMALARVLGARDPERLPVFTVADFHRSADGENERASTLAITLGLRHDVNRPEAAEDDRMRIALGEGGVSLRVVATRRDDADPTTSVSAIYDTGSPIEDLDAHAMLTELRRRNPALIVAGVRGAARRPGPPSEGAPGRARSALQDAADPREPLTWDRLGQVREELLRTASALADQLEPLPTRRRSVRDMTETPRLLGTDLRTALLDDAVPQRRIAALWLLMAIVDALPPNGLAVEADPILLFDDIEANLHPTWLAALTSIALHLPFQQIVSTYSPEVLTWVPLGSIRRLVRAPDGIATHSVVADGYSLDELRRLAYHLRLRRGNAFFARCWVLVEGETEAWLVPEFARIAGVEFPVEGIRVIEFAQTGLKPLMKVADDLGISWVMFVDGDEAGQKYLRTAAEHRRSGGGGASVTVPARDIENYLFKAGYDDVIRKAAGHTRKRKASEIIRVAIENTSKPALALEILAAADQRGAEGVPPVIRRLAETARDLARGATRR
jgi:putative ATP-dependent endonuclease of the OLD family